jgi:sec-independent protein translocase protein TatA
MEMAALSDLALPLIGWPSGPELIIALVIILILFGPKQLPKIGRALGGGIKEFKDGLKTGNLDEEEEAPRPESRTTVQAHPPEPLPSDQRSSTDSAPTEPVEKPGESSPS